MRNVPRIPCDTNQILLVPPSVRIQFSCSNTSSAHHESHGSASTRTAAPLLPRTSGSARSGPELLVLGAHSRTDQLHAFHSCTRASRDLISLTTSSAREEGTSQPDQPHSCSARVDHDQPHSGTTSPHTARSYATRSRASRTAVRTAAPVPRATLRACVFPDQPRLSAMRASSGVLQQLGLAARSASSRPLVDTNPVAAHPSSLSDQSHQLRARSTRASRGTHGPPLPLFSAAD